MDYYDYINYKLNGKYINREKLSTCLLENAKNIFNSEKSLPFYHVVNTINKGFKMNKFLLYFQPQYSLIEEKYIGFEALTRLMDSKGNILSPKEFIPVAEFTEQIFELEQWVFNTGLKHKKMLEELEYGQYHLSINLSAKTLLHDTYFKELMEIINSFDVNFENLIIEVTETNIISDTVKAYNNLTVLKSKGINIALDDFGTGFSSLSHLEEMPVDIVKIDQAMINKVPKNKRTCTIIKRILELSHELGYVVVAEGIENDLQLEFLNSIGCDIVQGYLFAKPMPSEDLMALIRE